MIAGGRQFNSLSDLVAYYTHCSDLLKRERLIHPTPPPEPVNDKKRIVAILPYTKMPDTDELSFQKGDIFFVHNDMGDGWLWVTAHRTGEQGLIFRELVEDLDDSIDPNTVFSWFHPNVTKSEAVDMLVKAGPGSFLVSNILLFSAFRFRFSLFLYFFSFFFLSISSFPFSLFAFSISFFPFYLFFQKQLQKNCLNFDFLNCFFLVKYFNLEENW